LYVSNLNRDVSSRPVDITIVVPTRNEAGNVAELLRRLDIACGEWHSEILIVDDSDDDTPDRVCQAAAASPRLVRLIYRPPGNREGGLGSAVLAGLREARGRWAVVMDGDLQHPPEVMPELVATGDNTGADVVIASRYRADGSRAGLGSHTREWVSSAATWATKAMFPGRLEGCTDPMSGFFALRTGTIDLDRLRPNGFKILLEILARSPKLRLAECSFRFAARYSGQSKASWREGMLFARRLVNLRFATLGRKWARSAGEMMRFGAVGLSGIVINSVALWMLVEGANLPLLVAAMLATQISATWNFLWTDRLVFRREKARRAWQRWLGFILLNNVVLVAQLPLLSVLVHAAGFPYVAANILTLIVGFIVRFVLSDRYFFARPKPVTAALGAPTRTGDVGPTCGTTGLQRHAPSLGHDRPARWSALATSLFGTRVTIRNVQRMLRVSREDAVSFASQEDGS
jgi:dolichol-phosphate mannosyltransferase